MRLAKLTVALCVLVVLVNIGVAAAETKLTFYFCCAQKERAEMFNRWARDFEAVNPGVKVDALYPVVTNENYYDKIKVAIAGDVAPDVMWNGLGLWGLADLLMPLDDLYASDPNIHEIVPAMINNHRWEGRLIAVPFGVNAHVAYYNKDFLGTAGVSMPRDWSWDEALSMTKKMTQDTNGDQTPDRWGMAFSESAHALNYGGNVYSDDMRKVIIDNPATIAGIQLTSDLMTGKIGGYYRLSSPAAAAAFLNGSIGIHTRGVFDIPTVKRDAKFDWDVTTYPRLMLDGKEYRTAYFSQETWTIYKGTKNPDLAKKFVSFIMQRERMGEFAKLGAVIPAQPSVAVRYFLNVSTPANMKAFTDTLNWYKNSERQNPASLAIDRFQTWKDIIAGNMSAAIGVPELARQMQVSVDEYWKNRK